MHRVCSLTCLSVGCTQSTVVGTLHGHPSLTRGSKTMECARSWDCQLCTFHNEALSSRCSMCGSLNQAKKKEDERPLSLDISSFSAASSSSSSASSTSLPSSSPRTWSCSACSFINTYTSNQRQQERVACEMCGTVKPPSLSPSSSSSAQSPWGFGFHSADLQNIVSAAPLFDLGALTSFSVDRRIIWNPKEMSLDDWLK